MQPSCKEKVHSLEECIATAREHNIGVWMASPQMQEAQNGKAAATPQGQLSESEQLRSLEFLPYL